MKQRQRPTQNLFQVGYNIFKKEGVTSLYKGMTPPLISLTILNTMTFTSYNYIRITYFNAKRGFDIRNFMAGFTIAPMASIISTVEHLVKTQMQLDNIRTTEKQISSTNTTNTTGTTNNKPRFRNSFHCVKTLIKEHGTIRILYLGHGVNTLREGVFIGTYFYTYEGMRILLDQTFGAGAGRYNTNNDDCNDRDATATATAAAWTIPFAGGLSGAWAWFVSFPLDCVKAGVQGQSLSSLSSSSLASSSSSSQRFKGMKAVFHELIKTKGWKGLYAGITPSIMRAFIVSSTRFTAYEMVVKLCSST